MVVATVVVGTGGADGRRYVHARASRIRPSRGTGRGLEGTKGAIHVRGNPFRIVGRVARATIGHGRRFLNRFGRSEAELE